MKYSLLMPYWKRPEIRHTFESFVHHYTSYRNDFEVIIIEDLRSKEDETAHKELLNIIDEYKDKFKIVYCLDNLRSYNSARKYNVGFEASSGKFIITTNPECFHEANVLAGLDKEFEVDANGYIVCSCKAVRFKVPVRQFDEMIKNNEMIMWYQHTAVNNRKLHFCSAMSRANYQKIGGFDDVKDNGIPLTLNVTVLLNVADDKNGPTINEFLCMKSNVTTTPLGNAGETVTVNAFGPVYDKSNEYVTNCGAEANVATCVVVFPETSII
jgi:hypothetical protein